MKIKIGSVALLVMCLFCVNAYGAISGKQIMEKADKAYQNGEYGAAADAYSSLLDSISREKVPAPELISLVRYLLGQVQLKQGKYAEARENMEGYYQKNPNNPFVVFDYALALFFTKKYPEAIPVFEKAAALNKKFEPEASYYIGAAKIVTGNIEGGRKDLTKIKELAPQSIEARNAEKLLVTLDKTLLEISGMEKLAAVTAVPGRPTKEKPWALSLSIGLEFDSNVALLPSEQSRPSDISSTGDWRAVHSLSGIYEFLNTGGNLMGVSGGVYGTNQIKDTDFNVESGFFSLYYKKNIADIFQLRISPFISKTWLNGSPHNWSWGLTPGISYQPVLWTWTDLNYTYSSIDFNHAPQFPQENRTGKAHNVILKQNFNFPSLLLPKRNTYFAGWLFGGKSETDGSSYNNESLGFGLQALQELPLDFTVLLAYSYGMVQYGDANIRSAANEKRDDRNQVLSINVFKKLPMICKNLTAYGGWRWYNNDSNINRYYSYRSNTYSIGLTLDL